MNQPNPTPTIQSDPDIHHALCLVEKACRGLNLTLEDVLKKLPEKHDADAWLFVKYLQDLGQGEQTAARLKRHT